VTNWYPYIELKNSNDSSPQTIQDALRSGNYSISLEKVRDAKLIDLSASAQGGPTSDSQREQAAFYAFLVFLIIYEGCFHAFIAWIVLKIIFWLLMIYSFLPGGKERRFRLQPLVIDPVFRYGLYDLHKPYNHLVFFLLVGAVAMSLNYVSNAAKGTFVYQSFGSGVFLGQMLIQTVIFTVIIMIIVCPIWLFGRALGKLKKKRLEELDLQICEANNLHNEKKAQELESEKAVVRHQTTWPWEDAGFRNLSVAFGTFVALPWLSMLHVMPDEFKKYASILNLTKQFMTELTAHIYHLN
jgi:uncharacterized membrane protein